MVKAERLFPIGYPKVVIMCFCGLDIGKPGNSCCAIVVGVTEGEIYFLESSVSVALLNSLATYATEVHFNLGTD